MEIRLLRENEFQMAEYTVREVFDCCVRNSIPSQEQIVQFYEYIRWDHLWKETQENRLIIWGAFEGGRMCGVSALQSDGQITLLHVKQPFWHRHIGSQMVNHMRTFSATVLHLNQLTAHVSPVFAAQFFYKIGFSYMPSARNDLPFVPVVCPLGNMAPGYQQGTLPPYMAPMAETVKPEVTYPTKKISTKVVMIITTVVLVLSTLAVAGVTVSQLLV